MALNGNEKTGKKIVFTVDVDRDLAWHKEGTHEAVTKNWDIALFDASHDGLKRTLELLKEEGIPATFFFEGAAAAEFDAREKKLNGKTRGLNSIVGFEHEVAAHGYHHEDFTGSSTGVIIPHAQKKAILKKTRAALEKVFPQRRVEGFRAPYLNYNTDLLALLAETGFTYDSSAYSKVPQVESLADGKLKEVPLAEGTDEHGKRMVSYLWPLMENNRTPLEYEGFARRVFAQGSDFLVLATHSWHCHMNVAGKRTESDVDAKFAQLRRVLRSLSGLGEFVTARQVAAVKPKN